MSDLLRMLLWPSCTVTCSTFRNETKIKLLNFEQLPLELLQAFYNILHKYTVVLPPSTWNSPLNAAQPWERCLFHGFHVLHDLLFACCSPAVHHLSIMCTCTGEHWPVDADGTEVEDGGGAQHHVHGHQPVTDSGAEGPHAVLELKQADTHMQCVHSYSLAALWFIHKQRNTLCRIKLCSQKRSGPSAEPWPLTTTLFSELWLMTAEGLYDDACSQFVWGEENICLKVKKKKTGVKTQLALLTSHGGGALSGLLEFTQLKGQFTVLHCNMLVTCRIQTLRCNTDTEMLRK